MPCCVTSSPKFDCRGRRFFPLTVVACRWGFLLSSPGHEGRMYTHYQSTLKNSAPVHTVEGAPLNWRRASNFPWPSPLNFVMVTKAGWHGWFDALCRRASPHSAFLLWKMRNKYNSVSIRTWVGSHQNEWKGIMVICTWGGSKDHRSLGQVVMGRVWPS